MKEQSGFAIQQHPDETTFLEVTASAADRWRVSAHETDHAGAGPSSGLAKSLAEAREQALWILPNDEVKTALATFPKLGRRELARALPGWIAREEGGAPEDWVLDSKAVAGQAGRAATEQQDIFLLYTSRRVVENTQARAADWKIPSPGLLPGFMILDQFFRNHGPESSTLGVWNLVFLGRRDNFMCISTREHPLLVRPLPADLSEGKDRLEYLGRLTTEVDRSVSFARQTENSPQVERIIVCGQSELAHDLVRHMEQEMATPAQVWDLQSHFEGVYDRQDPDLLLPMAAAALAFGERQFNLGPKQRREWPGPRARRRILLGTGTAAAALVPLLLVGGLVTLKVQDAYLLEARGRLPEATANSIRAGDVYQAQRILLAREVRMNRFVAKSPDFQSVLLRIAALTPAEVVYDDLRIRERPDGRYFLQLEGTAVAGTAQQAQQAFLTLLASLNECDFMAGAGEPKQMKIAGAKRDNRPVKSTFFSLEYQLLPPRTREEG